MFEWLDSKTTKAKRTTYSSSCMVNNINFFNLIMNPCFKGKLYWIPNIAACFALKPRRFLHINSWPLLHKETKSGLVLSKTWHRPLGDLGQWRPCTCLDLATFKALIMTQIMTNKCTYYMVLNLIQRKIWHKTTKFSTRFIVVKVTIEMSPTLGTPLYTM